MPNFDIVVYRNRVERMVIKVTAESQYEATDAALEAVEEGHAVDREWELLDLRAQWYAGDNNYDNQPYCIETNPRIFYEDGTSRELPPVIK